MWEIVAQAIQVGILLVAISGMVYPLHQQNKARAAQNAGKLDAIVVQQTSIMKLLRRHDRRTRKTARRVSRLEDHVYTDSPNRRSRPAQARQ